LPPFFTMLPIALIACPFCLALPCIGGCCAALKRVFRVLRKIRG
jgi:hypothetical protein